MRIRFSAMLTAIALSCGNQPSSVVLIQDRITGLDGVVRRGPIQPVCRVGEPCDAPFSAGFALWQEQRLVARFRSDSAGHYSVLAAPGAYTIVADPDAPIWPPHQAHAVIVDADGLTHLDLDFDTGIR
jgi:hypothetical protein